MLARRLTGLLHLHPLVSCTQKTLSFLRVVYNNIFRMLLWLPRFCSASGTMHKWMGLGWEQIVYTKLIILILIELNILLLNSTCHTISHLRHFLTNLSYVYSIEPRSKDLKLNAWRSRKTCQEHSRRYACH